MSIKDVINFIEKLGYSAYVIINIFPNAQMFWHYFTAILNVQLIRKSNYKYNCIELLTAY